MTRSLIKSADRDTEHDERFMRLCLEYAQKGVGFVSPNPMVGAVVVRDNEIVGVGWHQRYGGAHAEINALAMAGEKASGADMYVNLEPCNHSGQTPPCTEAIIAHGIARVIIGARDPNPHVTGAGIKRLRSAKIAVTTEILQEESHEINKFFFKWILTALPYVTVKLAQTLDGKIAGTQKKQKQISSIESLVYSHTLRSQYDAILIGSGTLTADKPRMTVRRVKGRNPVRVILDSTLRGKYDEPFLGENARTIVFTSLDSWRSAKCLRLLREGAQCIASPLQTNKIDLHFVLRSLGTMGITSLLVEGGSAIATSFVNAGVADELLLFIAPKFYGKGVPAFGALSGKIPNFVKFSAQNIGDDILIDGVFRKHD